MRRIIDHMKEDKMLQRFFLELQLYYLIKKIGISLQEMKELAFVLLFGQDRLCDLALIYSMNKLGENKK